MPKGIYKHSPLSEETKKKLSQSLKGRKPKFIPDNRGLIRSDETRKKISDAGKGRKQSPETIAKRSKSLMGKIPWNKGKKCPEMSGEKSYNWKGDNVGYWGIHDWIRKELGRPMHCALCQSVTAKKYEWANISHSYKRELSDWIRLCTKCHIAYDKGKIKL